MSWRCVGVLVAGLGGGCGMLLLAGCGGGSCGSSVPVPVIITVSNATTGRSICNATVIASGPDLTGAGADARANSEILSSEGGTCGFEFATEVTFTLQVSAPGFRSGTAGGGGQSYSGCGGPSPPPDHLNVALTPN
jgi:hypothetical protein